MSLSPEELLEKMADSAYGMPINCRSDEEAIKESEDLFGVKNANENHDIVIVCDDCFKKLMKGRK